MNEEDARQLYETKIEYAIQELLPFGAGPLNDTALRRALLSTK